MSELSQSAPLGEFGPALRGRGRRNPWMRAGMALLATVVAGALFVTGTTFALLKKGEASIERVQVDGLSEPGDLDGDGIPETEEITDVLNVLVVGSDSRKGLTDEQLALIGTDDPGSELTDTIMLLQLDPNRDKVALLSFPRDLRVELCNGRVAKINAAYAVGEAAEVGGPSCLVQTVEAFTGIHIHHYVQISFGGFINAIDAVGGVSFYLDKPIRDRDANIDLDAGCVTLNGVDALAFVRVRKIDSDFGRIARQQRLIRELLDKMTSVGTLVNVPRMFSLVETVGSSIQADDKLSLSRMQRIAFSLRNLTNDGLETRTVPGVSKRIDDQDFVVADLDEANLLFTAFREGTIFPDDVGTGPVRELGAADVPPVLVLNGAGLAGLAAQGAELLEERGFQVAGTDNAESFDVTTTTILHGPSHESEATLLAKVLPGSKLGPSEPGTPLTVVLGSDLDIEQLLDEVRATSEPSPTVTAPASPPEPAPTPTFRGATPSEVQC